MCKIYVVDDISNNVFNQDVFLLDMSLNIVLSGTRSIDIHRLNKSIGLILMKSLDPLRAKKTFIRKKLGHTAVSAIKASSVTV